MRASMVLSHCNKPLANNLPISKWLYRTPQKKSPNRIETVQLTSIEHSFSIGSGPFPSFLGLFLWCYHQVKVQQKFRGPTRADFDPYFTELNQCEPSAIFQRKKIVLETGGLARFNGTNHPWNQTMVTSHMGKNHWLNLATAHIQPQLVSARN